MGTPKALVRCADGTPWLHRSLAALDDGGCARLVVVLGAAHGEARALLTHPTAYDVLRARPEVVVADDWDEGMGASLRAGLAHLAAPSDPGGSSPDPVSLTAPVPAVAVVSLVDLPDVGADVVRRLLDAVSTAGQGAATLARAAYAGVAGHPVVLGADHWRPVAEVARGDRGARDYLADRRVLLVECGDLATGTDRDTPQSADTLSEGARRG